MENRGSADNVAKDSSRAGGIQEHDFAEEFSSDLPSMAMSSSAPSASSPYYASLSSPSAAKVDDRDVAHGAGRVGDTKKLEHALPSDPMQLPVGFGMVDSMGRPPVVYASNSDVGPGAFPVRSSRDAATSRTVRSPVGSYANAREFTNEESKQEDVVPNSAAAGMGVYAVEAQRVPDGNEDGTVLVAEAQYVRTKWYHRRWISVGLACGFVGAVVVIVVLVVRQPSASSSSSLTSPPSIPELTAAPPTPVPSEDAPSTPEPSTAPTTTAPITTAPATPDPTTAPPTTAPITSAPSTPEPTTAPPTTAPITMAPATPDPTTAPPTTVQITGAPSTPEPTTAPPTTVPISTAPATPDPTPPPPTFAPIVPISPTPNPINTALPTQAPTTRRPTTTSKPTPFLTPFGIACNFLSITNVTKCQSTFENSGTTTGSTIPTEIGLLTQLTYLIFYNNDLTGTIPTEIGLLTKLTWLDFARNQLKGTIPSSLCSLPSFRTSVFSCCALQSPGNGCCPPSPVTYILIDCGEITCASGCCRDGDTRSPCG